MLVAGEPAGKPVGSFGIAACAQHLVRLQLKRFIGGIGRLGGEIEVQCVRAGRWEGVRKYSSITPSSAGQWVERQVVPMVP